jgi:hypothetical protein
MPVRTISSFVNMPFKYDQSNSDPLITRVLKKNIGIYFFDDQAYVSEIACLSNIKVKFSYERC